MPEVKSLAEVLTPCDMERGRALRLARQIADQFCHARQQHLSYAGLTVNDVSLIGSAGEERIVLNVSEAEYRPSIASDMQAFGRLLEAMAPGHPLAVQCLSRQASERPDSFELVLEELQEGSAVRTWIGSLLMGAAMASLLFYELAHQHAGI